MVRYYTSLFFYFVIALLLQVINVDLVRVITNLANFSETGSVNITKIRPFDRLFHYGCSGRLDFVENQDPGAQAAISGLRLTLAD